MSFDYSRKNHRWRRLRERVLREAGYRCQWAKRYGRRVEEDTTVRVPKGGISLLDQRGKDQYSAWQVVKYLAPGWDRHERPKPRRRRRR